MRAARSGPLRSELVARLLAAPANLLAGCQQFAAGALSERFHADRGKKIVGRTQLFARIDASPFASQPFAVQQTRASEFRTDSRAAQAVDGFAVRSLGSLTVA